MFFRRSAGCSTASASAPRASRSCWPTPDDVPDRHLARARARRRGDLLLRQAARGAHALRRARRQPRPPARRRRRGRSGVGARWATRRWPARSRGPTPRCARWPARRGSIARLRPEIGEQRPDHASRTRRRRPRRRRPGRDLRTPVRGLMARDSRHDAVDRRRRPQRPRRRRLPGPRRALGARARAPRPGRRRRRVRARRSPASTRGCRATPTSSACCRGGSSTSSGCSCASRAAASRPTRPIRARPAPRRCSSTPRTASATRASFAARPATPAPSRLGAPVRRRRRVGARACSRR